MRTHSLRFLLLLLGALALGGVAGWQAARRFASHPSDAPPTGEPSTARRVLFYQSAMHPWIKSDHPGKCTICGMELTPVFEGEAGLSVEPGLVTLSSNSISVLNVQTSPVRRGPLLRTLRVAGTIEDDDTRHRFLSASVAGRIDELMVDHLGAEVAAGQALARYYSPMLLEAERQYVALAPANPGPTSTPAPADRPLAALFEEKDLLRASAAQRLRQLGLTETQIAELPAKSPTNVNSILLAPVSGTVVARFVYAGQYVMEGERLFELADFSTMWFQFEAYEQDLAWLQPGQSVTVTTASVPDRTFQAPIRFIDPNLNPTTRSARVRVELPNPIGPETNGAPRRLLRHRLYAEGLVQVSSPEVVLVPRSAVLSPGGRPVVYVDQTAGGYAQRPVRLGRTGDTDYEVLSGLEPGERVVTAGNLMIDAQAQLNQTIQEAEPSHEHPAPSAASTPALPLLSPTQVESLSAFLASADELRVALAADNLRGFNDAARALPAAAQRPKTQFPAGDPWLPHLEAAERETKLGPADSLRAARQSYHPLSSALVELARTLRNQGTPGSFGDLRVFQCPMSAEAFDGAPRRALWFQLGLPLRNPWFGAEMLDCGTEVRP